ncbi:hypothetical protein TSUD_58120 [Trifolium subterraneum]|uniref:Reverse transcriptase zinc-binding domain-containing protein n=1 Tax=Trifolium subterraneum TaxID=3900 RepID=A0A2Z6MJJ6_TRISU|nr:hypothetical protein TSUD_58120 [Trifolium subterraneum]
METKSWANVHALRVVLVLFETMSGLKVNFNKSMLVGVNIPDFWKVVLEDVNGQGGLMVSSVGSPIWGGERQIVCMRDEKVGDESDTFFWTDPWVDGTPLSEWFERLFDLAVYKSVSVADMFLLGWEVGGDAWVWRRPLRAWEEEMLGECQTLLLTISLQAHSSDKWLWQPNLDGGYTVPLKVSILAWRLLRDRLPTKANLTSRGILTVGDLHCVSGWERLSWLSMCSSLVALLDLYGLLSALGLVRLR